MDFTRGRILDNWLDLLTPHQVPNGIDELPRTDYLYLPNALELKGALRLIWGSSTPLRQLSGSTLYDHSDVLYNPELIYRHFE